MPHQCLKCGEIFQEGSPQLLKGCPECGGHRFFFTKKPLDGPQRDKINQEVNQDMTEKIMDLLMEKNNNTDSKPGKWVTIKPKEIRKMLQQNINHTTHQDITETSAIKTEPIKQINSKKIINELLQEADSSDTPETIDIEQPGKYNIDLKGLLEQEPIIVQKDGSYTIHLPSVFKMIENNK